MPPVDEIKFTKEEVKEMHEVTKQLRAAVEASGGKMTSEIEKLSAKLDAFEVKNQAMTAQHAAIESANRELKEKIEVLDKHICRAGGNRESDKLAYRFTPEYKMIDAYVKHGEKALMNPEFKGTELRTDVDAQGGYLVPKELSMILLKQVEEISPVREFARKWTSQVKSLAVPVRKSIPSAPYEGELEDAEDSASEYRSETLTGWRQMARIPATMDLLLFSNYNMESEILQDASLAFAKTEGAKFVSGSGVKEPEGILTNADVASTDTTQSFGAITGDVFIDDVINLIGQLKVGYNGRYFFNRTTLAFLRTAKSTAGGYLWTVGGETMPSQLAGFPYAIFQDMPSISAGIGSKVVGFGDLFMGYSILDSVQVAVVRDQLTEAKKGLVIFNIFRWNTGQVAIPEAIKLLKVKA